jgi:hypothetical protein
MIQREGRKKKKLKCVEPTFYFFAGPILGHTTHTYNLQVPWKSRQFVKP